MISTLNKLVKCIKSIIAYLEWSFNCDLFKTKLDKKKRKTIVGQYLRHVLSAKLW